MTYGVTPVLGFPPPLTEDFPNYIQFQWNGVDLGAPNADTINFVGAGFTLVRGGSGVDDNTITITLG
jgi:hypothetical protein